MPESVHVHPPHELTEPSDDVSPRERVFEIVAALLLSIATIGVAWSGYQAARWSGTQARLYTQAGAERSLANRASTLAAQDRLQDLLNFNRWLEVSTDGNTELASLYQRRFRPEFLPAFAAWQAQDPVDNTSAISSPLRLPQYKLANRIRSDRLEQRADHDFAEGRTATEHADDYVFSTVFFAAVMFFAGMSLRFAWDRLRMIVLVISVAFLVYGVIRVGSLPTL